MRTPARGKAPGSIWGFEMSILESALKHAEDHCEESSHWSSCHNMEDEDLCPACTILLALQQASSEIAVKEQDRVGAIRIQRELSEKLRESRAEVESLQDLDGYRMQAISDLADAGEVDDKVVALQKLADEQGRVMRDLRRKLDREFNIVADLDTAIKNWRDATGANSPPNFIVRLGRVERARSLLQPLREQIEQSQGSGPWSRVCEADEDLKLFLEEAGAEGEVHELKAKYQLALEDVVVAREIADALSESLAEWKAVTGCNSTARFMAYKQRLFKALELLQPLCNESVMQSQALGPWRTVREAVAKLESFFASTAPADPPDMDELRQNLFDHLIGHMADLGTAAARKIAAKAVFATLSTLEGSGEFPYCVVIPDGCDQLLLRGEDHHLFIERCRELGLAL